jgi:hypothetical protein
VKVRLPGIAAAQRNRHSDGAVRLKFVTEALAQASADMFVNFASNGSDVLPVAEHELSDGGLIASYPEEEDAIVSGPLARYGATTHISYEADDPYFLSVWVDAKPCPDGMPGLVWEVEGDVTFVTLDGETYRFDLKGRSRIPLGAGPPDPPDRWPPPGTTPGFGRWALAQGRRSAPVKKSLGTADRAFGACARRAAKQIDNAVGPDGKLATRDPQLREWMMAGGDPRARLIRRDCKKPIDAWEKAWGDVIEANLKERAALYEKARARLRALKPGG